MVTLVVPQKFQYPHSSTGGDIWSTIGSRDDVPTSSVFLYFRHSAKLQFTSTLSHCEITQDKYWTWSEEYNRGSSLVKAVDIYLAGKPIFRVVKPSKGDHYVEFHEGISPHYKKAIAARLAPPKD